MRRKERLKKGYAFSMACHFAYYYHAFSLTPLRDLSANNTNFRPSRKYKPLLFSSINSSSRASYGTFVSEVCPLHNGIVIQLRSKFVWLIVLCLNVALDTCILILLSNSWLGPIKAIEIGLDGEFVDLFGTMFLFLNGTELKIVGGITKLQCHA